MNARDGFSVGLRIIGLFAFGRGFDDLFYFAVLYLGLKTTSVSAELPYYDLILGIFYFSAGLYLIRGAPIILDYAFPNNTIENELETEQEAPDNMENQ